MNIEIEKVSNGYIVVLAKNGFNEAIYDEKILVQNEESETQDDATIEFQTFSELVDTLQEVFGIENTKHNKIGYINGLCSEDKRWDIKRTMEESLKNPKNDLGDD
ncbi:MAG: hypothetical protein Q9M43_06805 [Sulfurimonas sp.]|nr:hypothetical protein [Sulfurimonas sp.]